MNRQFAKIAALFTLMLFALGTVQAQLLPTPPAKKEQSDPEATKILKKLKDKYSVFPAINSDYTLTIMGIKFFAMVLRFGCI